MEAASDHSRKPSSRTDGGWSTSYYGFTRYRERASFKSALRHAPRWAACSQKVRPTS